MFVNCAAGGSGERGKGFAFELEHFLCFLDEERLDPRFDIRG